MKQRIRRIWLALCMAVCLFALAGCSAAADTAETIDPQIEMAMQSGSQQYLDLFNQMDDASRTGPCNKRKEQRYCYGECVKILGFH